MHARYQYIATLLTLTMVLSVATPVGAVPTPDSPTENVTPATVVPPDQFGGAAAAPGPSDNRSNDSDAETLPWPLERTMAADAGGQAGGSPDGDGGVGEKPPRNLTSAAAERIDAAKAAGRSNVTLRINAKSGRGKQVRGLVRRNGARVLSQYRDQMVVRIAPTVARSVANHPAVNYVQTPEVPEPTTGSITSEGIYNMSADDVHAEGYRGGNATLAVIGIEFNASNPEIEPNVVDVKDMTSGETFTNASSGTHGTAVAEIVADTAPNVSLVLIDIDTVTEWLNAYDYAESAGANVTVASLGISTGPFNGSGPLGDEIGQARANGTPSFISAGNAGGGKHLNITWNDPDGDDRLNFEGSDERNRVTTAASRISIDVSWNDYPYSWNDYDVYINDSNGNVIASSRNWQNGSVAPEESVTVTNLNKCPCYLTITSWSANDSADFDIFANDGTDLEHNTSLRSITRPATDEDAITVGAVYYKDLELEPFSSRGPTIDGRRKPEILAPDGTSTSVYGSAPSNGFYGTSAAAPHAAGAAALLVDANTSITPAYLERVLMETAEQTDPTYSSPDPNNNTGEGMVNVSAALDLMQSSGGNDPPVASDDFNVTAEDTTLSVSAPGVLANDTDPNGDNLTVNTTPVIAPTNGTLTLYEGGAFEYTPDPNFSGTDGFVYEVRDGNGGNDTATVEINVSAVNDPPTAEDDANTTSEDVNLSVSAPGVLVNDSDVDGDNLTMNTTPVVAPTNGTLVLNADGSYTYDPDPDFNGTDAFVYEVGDGNGGTDTATVNLTVSAVNDAPTAENDSNTTTEDTALSVSSPGVLANDSDVEGDNLTVTTTAVDAPDNGSLTLYEGGAYEYTPDPNFSGTDSFTYEVSDGNGGTDTATVTITVSATNDAPTATNDSASTDEDTTLSVSAPGVLGNDSDVDGDSLTATLVDDVTNGTLTLYGNGSYEYVPNPNFAGEDSFVYRAHDGNGGTDTATVTITVTSVNDPPTARDDSNTTAEDTTLTVSAPGVLANDSDVEGDNLTATLVDDATHGAVTLYGDGSYEYVPNANFSGTDSFTYEVLDGNGGNDTATVTLTVTATNDAPVASDDSASTSEDTTLSVSAPGVLGNDSDVDGDNLTVTTTAVDAPDNGTLTLSEGGAYEYTPESNFSGTDSFTYEVSDGTTTDTATVTITVSAVNDAPTATNDSASTDEDTTLTVSSPGVLSNDDDVEGDNLTVTTTAVDAPDNGTLTLYEGGAYEYTPDPNFSGTDSFTYEVSDGTTTDTATVTITVSAVNDAPTASGDDATVEENATLSVSAPGVLGNDSDVEGDNLTVTTTAVDAPDNGSLTLYEGGAFEYTPDPGFAGTDSFTYEVSDGNGGTDTATVTVTVEPVTLLASEWNHSMEPRQQYSSPAVGPTRVFVGGLGESVTALYRANGSVAWQFQRDGSLVDSSPTLYDGRVIVGGGNGTVWALWANNGSVDWSVTNDSAVVSSPTVAGGTVYVGSNDGTVHAIDATTGSVVWTHEVGSPVLSTPAVAAGQVFVTTDDGSVVALSTADGSQQWSYATGATDWGHASPIVADGAVYVAAEKVYALDPADGSVTWSTAYGGSAETTPAYDGSTLYVGSADGSVYALNGSTGTVTWTHATGGTVGSPTVVSGRVLVGSGDDTVYLLNATTGSSVASRGVGTVRSTPTVAGDVAYVGTWGGSVMAMGNVTDG